MQEPTSMQRIAAEQESSYMEPHRASRASRVFACVAVTVGLGLVPSVSCSSGGGDTEPTKANANAALDGTSTSSGTSASNSAVAATLSGSQPSKTWPRERYYQSVLPLMDNDERMRFFDMENDYRRDLYLREIGADCRLDLNTLVKVGMTLNEVRNQFPTELWDPTPSRVGDVDMWHFRRFNGRGYTRMIVSFVDGKAIEWMSFSDQTQMNDEQILAECSRIERELGKILTKGTPQTALPRQIELAPTYTAQMLAAATKDLSVEPWDIKVKRAQFEQQMRAYLLLADKAHPEANPKEDPVKGYALKFKEPAEVRHEGRRSTWRYETAFGARKIYYFIEFMDRELIRWHAEPATRR